jgi:hypothetical protein
MMIYYIESFHEGEDVYCSHLDSEVLKSRKFVSFL